MNRNLKLLLVALVALTAFGCAGTQTFHELARPGDTVAVAAGYRHHFQRDNITVTITDANGATTVYPAGSAKVRAAVNLYPDPLSSWVVSDRIGVDQTSNAQLYSFQNLAQNTEADYDWWQTVVFIDLPVTMESPEQPMAEGNTSILIETPSGPDQETFTANVNIVSGVGQAHNFSAITKTFVPFNLDDQHMQAMERVPHVTLDFSGTTVPYAIQVDLSHEADQDSGGSTGDKAYVANPVGHIKSVNWHDDGINTRIITMPNRDSDITDFKDFKLYLAGIGGWTVVGAQGFTQNGVLLEAPDNITASINP